jgi:hypothetical protein
VELTSAFDTVHRDSILNKKLMRFFDVSFGGIDVSDAPCSRWNTFLSATAISQAGYFPTSVTIVKHDSLSDKYGNGKNVTCSSRSLSKLLIDGLIANSPSGKKTAQPVSITCTDPSDKDLKSIWTVSRCGDAVSLRVIVGDQTVFYTSPCNSTCTPTIRSTSGAVLGFSVALAAYYPPPTMQGLVVTASANSVTATVSLSGAGLVSCAAYPSTGFLAPSSVEAIIVNGVSAWSLNNVSLINIFPLSANMQYTVLCCASSSQGISTPIDVAVANRVSATTNCCRSLSVSVISKNVLVSSTSFNAVVLTLSELPGTNLRLELSVRGGLDNSSFSLLSPAVVNAGPSTPKSFNFTWLPTAVVGPFTVSVVAVGNEKSLYETSFSGGNNVVRVYDVKQSPYPPVLKSALYSADGANVTATFDSGTDLSGLGSGVFGCSRLFSFLGAATASCRWNSIATAIVIKFPSGGVTATAYPDVGGAVTLLPNTIKAACPASVNCANWTFSPTTKVYISAPAQLLAPIVMISAPTVVGTCTDVTVDISSSTGSGGRSWQSVSIRIDSPNVDSSGLQRYLDTDIVQASLQSTMRITVPYSYFFGIKIFTITVRLCNFLNSCGQQQVFSTMVSMNSPVSIMGTSMRSQYSSQSLALKAVAYLSTCDGGVHSSLLSYSWALNPRSTSGQLDAGKLPLISDASMYFINAFVLKPLDTYDISVTVTSLLTQMSSTSSVTVSVGQNAIVAVIAGGGYRSHRVGEWSTVDGSGSYDRDQYGGGNVGMTFTWNVYQLLPYFASQCNIQQRYQRQPVWGFFAFVNATNSTCGLSLEASLDARFANALTSIYFIALANPNVLISTTSNEVTHVKTSAKLTVLASVSNLATPLHCDWTSDDRSITLSAIALTPTSTTVPAGMLSSSSYGFTAVNLVLMPSVLIGGSQYTLSLNFKAEGGERVGATSSITVSTNGFPVPGVFSVEPTIGTALVTQFSFTAFAWSDDGDYPLAFEFAFDSPVGARSTVVSSRSQTSSGTSTLPAGSPILNFALTCRLNVYDAFSAVNSLTSLVHVNATHVNTSALSALLAAGVAGAGLNLDSLKQTIVNTAVTVNSVNCGNAPNCSRLNRHECTSVSHTCGSCYDYDEFVGQNGASNEPCVKASVIGQSGSHAIDCAVDTDCASVWYSCDVTTGSCYSPPKSCNCSGHGTCEFVDSNTGFRVLSCLRSEPTCVARCICDAGYFGAICDVDSEENTARQRIRSQLVASMSTVLHSESGAELSTVVNWANSLSTIASKPLEMTSDTLLDTLDMVEYILEKSTANGHPVDALGSLFDTIDSCIESTFGSAGSTADRRVLVSAVSSSVTSVLDSISSATSAELVVGQGEISTIRSNYRLTSQIARSLPLTLAVPLSVNEETMNIRNSRVDMPVSPGGIVSMMSLKSSVFTTYDPPQSRYETMGNYLANPTRLSFTGYHCSETNSSSNKVTFSFKNSATTNSSALIDDLNITHVTTCTRGVVQTMNYSCPYGSNITHTCTGYSDYSITTQCATQKLVPQCVLSTVAASHSCSLVSFTEDWTVCSCSLCDFNESIGSNQRKLQSVSRYVGEVQSLTTYLASDYSAVTVAVEDFNLNTLKDTSLILGTFAFVWGVMFVVIAGIDFTDAADNFDNMVGKRLLSLLGYSTRRKHTNMLDSAHVSLEDAKGFMKAYVFTFFPNVYSEKPEGLKFWHEIVHKHRYLAIFAMDKGARKFVGGLEVLTLLTAHMFLIAVLYDAQWPNDDGFCSTQLTETDCLLHTSIFDSKQPMCAWQPSTSGQQTDVTVMTCVWIPPLYDPVIQVLLTMIVIAFSGPINAITSVIVKVIVLSPTKEEVLKREHAIRTRRASAVSGIQAGAAAARTARNKRPRVAPVHDTAVSELTRSAAPVSVELSVRKASLLRSLGKKSFREVVVESVARVPDLDETLMAYCLDDQLMRRRIANIFDKNLNPLPSLESVGATTPWNELQKNCIPTSADVVVTLVKQLREQRERLAGDARMQLEEQWDAVLGPPNLPQDSNLKLSRVPIVVTRVRKGHRETVAAKPIDVLLAEEIDLVRSEAQKSITRLRKLPDTMIGVQILEMFVLDLMGRHSSQAKLFANQRTAISTKIVTSVWLKGFAVAFLVVLNAYFIIMCVSYGQLKGRKWQLNWMFSCLAYLFVDIFIKHVNIVFMVYYYIPDLIKTDTATMKERLTKAIDSFVKRSYHKARKHAQSKSGSGSQQLSAHANKRNEVKFSVTDPFFVSSHVARAFPNLLESGIVLAYRSLTLSAQHAEMLQLPLRSKQQKLETLRQTREWRREQGWKEWSSECISEWKWKTFVSVVSVTAVNMLITLGCQNILVQKIVVQMFDPVLVGAVALIGSLIIQHTLVGVPVVVSIFLCVGLFAFLSYRKRVLRRKQTEVTDLPSAHAVAEHAQPAVAESCSSDEDGYASSHYELEIPAKNSMDARDVINELKCLPQYKNDGRRGRSDDLGPVVDDFDDFDDYDTPSERDISHANGEDLYGPIMEPHFSEDCHYSNVANNLHSDDGDHSDHDSENTGSEATGLHLVGSSDRKGVGGQGRGCAPEYKHEYMLHEHAQGSYRDEQSCHSDWDTPSEADDDVPTLREVHNQYLSSRETHVLMGDHVLDDDFDVDDDDDDEGNHLDGHPHLEDDFDD